MARTGRPTLYTPDIARRARAAWELGATDRQVAAILGVNPDTLRRWCREHGEMADARAAGRDRAGMRVQHALYRRAIGYDYEETRDVVPFGAKQPVAVTATRHMPAQASTAFRWMQIHHGGIWSGRADPGGDDAEFVERLESALANVAAGRAADDDAG